jgi:hypothetical protein
MTYICCRQKQGKMAKLEIYTQSTQNQEVTDLFNNGCITDDAFNKMMFGMELTFTTHIQGGIIIKVKRIGKTQEFKFYIKDSESGKFYVVNNTNGIGFSLYGESQNFWKLTEIK